MVLSLLSHGVIPDLDQGVPGSGNDRSDITNNFPDAVGNPVEMIVQRVRQAGSSGCDGIVAHPCNPPPNSRSVAYDCSAREAQMHVESNGAHGGVVQVRSEVSFESGLKVKTDFCGFSCPDHGPGAHGND